MNSSINQCWVKTQTECLNLCKRDSSAQNNCFDESLNKKNEAKENENSTWFCCKTIDNLKDSCLEKKESNLNIQVPPPHLPKPPTSQVISIESIKPFETSELIKPVEQNILRMSPFEDPNPENSNINALFAQYDTKTEEDYIYSTLFLKIFYDNHDKYLRVLKNLIIQIINPTEAIEKFYKKLKDEISREHKRLTSIAKKANVANEKERIDFDYDQLVKQVDNLVQKLIHNLEKNKKAIHDHKEEIKKLKAVLGMVKPIVNDEIYKVEHRCNMAKNFEARLHTLNDKLRKTVFSERIKCFQAKHNDMGFLYDKQTIDLSLKSRYKFENFFKKNESMRFKVLPVTYNNRKFNKFVIIGGTKLGNEKTILIFNSCNHSCVQKIFNAKEISYIQTNKTNLFAFKYVEITKNIEQIIVLNDNLEIIKRLFSSLSLVGSSDLYLFLLDELSKNIHFYDWNLQFQLVVPFQNFNPNEAFYIENNKIIDQFYYNNNDNDQEEETADTDIDYMKFFKYGFVINDKMNQEKEELLVYNHEGKFKLRVKINNKKARLDKIGLLICLEENKLKHFSLNGHLNEVVEFIGAPNLKEILFDIDDHDQIHIFNTENLLLYF